MFRRTYLAPTPQSRRYAPRQLPFQGSRGVGGYLSTLRICLPRCGYLRSADTRRGRRPRRPFRWMTDGVGLLLNVASRLVGRTVPGAPSVGQQTASFPRGNPSPRSPLRCVSAAVDRSRTFGVTDFNRVSNGAHGNVHRPTYHIPQAPPAHHFVRAYRRRPSTDAGRAWKISPYGWCEHAKRTGLRPVLFAEVPASVSGGFC